MKKNFCKKLTKALLMTAVFTAFPVFSETTMEATSHIDWTKREFLTNLTLDTNKAQIVMPSGKKKASGIIKAKMPELTQAPLLSLFADSSYCLSDYVVTDRITLDYVYSFINSGYKTPDIFSADAASLNTTNTLNIDDLGCVLVKHRYASKPEDPIDSVPSRAYSGIIIDARGKLQVHGEYVKEVVSASFFPVIWDENMNIIYEKNNTIPQNIIENGLVCFDYDETSENCEARVGNDPLYIRAVEVYGTNRTDPVIKRKDALKILTVPENIKLLQEGKVAILLDKPQLIYDIAVPEKDETYYVKYEAIKQHFYQNKVNDIAVEDTDGGLLFAVNLNFYPDSPVLLPGEQKRIASIAETIKELLIDDGYTILVEGHTADVGKPIGQLNLSIDRSVAVRNALIQEGLDPSIFTYKGYGGTMPIDTNLTEEGRAKNRRVYITARPRATYIQRDWN